MKPEITVEEAQARVAGKVYPKVTKESIEGRIAEVQYSVMGTLTICVIRMVNGFSQSGVSAPADPRNFDAEVGRRYAYEDAFRGLWKLEGYLLCERLSQR